MSPLILALNPCIDVEWLVDHVEWEEKNSVLSERRWAGGKAVNLFRWLSSLSQFPFTGKDAIPCVPNISIPLSPSKGERGPIVPRSQSTPTLPEACCLKFDASPPPTLLLPLGGPTGTELARSLRSQNLKFKLIPLCEPTRANVIITEPPSPKGRLRQLRFNPLGPKLSRAEWGRLLESTKRLLPRASCLILSGSLPRGIPTTAYAQLIRLARSAGIKTLLDCDGDAFAAAAQARPFLVKPNEHELAQWSGKSLRSESAILRAARDLSKTTRGWVLVSRGPRRSFLLHEQNRVLYFGQPPRVTPLNTVGAGDALLAAVAQQFQLGAPPEHWLRWGIAAGTASTQCLPGVLPSPAVIHCCFRQVISRSADL